MTTIHLKMKTIREYLGETHFNGCCKISEIHLARDVDRPSEVLVKARIPPSTTYGADYIITVRLLSSGASILDSSCTCPIGYKCKHIHKVLCRIRGSRDEPLNGPSKSYQARVALEHRKEQKTSYGSVWIAMTCNKEEDVDGADDVNGEYDHYILGVFFSIEEANGRAAEYFDWLCDEDDEDDDDFDTHGDDDVYAFEWSGDEHGIFDDKFGGREYTRVWVEEHAIEDATNRFHE